MAKICYRPGSFFANSLDLIDKINVIIDEYRADGYDATLRQIHYGLVTINAIENTDKSYDSLGELVSKARYAGKIDWDGVEDRIRDLEGVNHCQDYNKIVASTPYQLSIGKWDNQKFVPELWVEKDAQSQVVSRTARKNDVNVMVCRGYMSSSEMHVAALRYINLIKNDQEPIIIHLGDHDPSGIHMTVDIVKRIKEFMDYHIGRSVTMKRICLNIDQVRQYELPPNPTKPKDSRTGGYIETFGNLCWELDALKPRQLDALMQAAIDEVRDGKKLKATLRKEEKLRKPLYALAKNWDRIQELIESGELDKPAPRKPRFTDMAR